MIDFCKKHQQKVRYLLVGFWNTIFGYATFAGLYYFLGIRVHYEFILILSYVISITNAYIGYKLVVFKTKGNYFKEYVRFYVVYGTIFVINSLSMPLLVEVFDLHPLLAQAIIIFITTVASYFSHRNFSFNIKK